MASYNLGTTYHNHILLENEGKMVMWIVVEREAIGEEALSVRIEPITAGQGVQEACVYVGHEPAWIAPDHTEEPTAVFNKQQASRT